MKKTFPLTPEKFASLRSQLAALGTILPDGDSGSFSPPGHSEITLGFAYADGVLELTILHSSWYESSGAIWNGLAPYLS